MPRAYYQCPVCRETASNRYHGMKRNPVACYCRGEDQPTTMRYRGDGREGRNNMPFGTPPGWRRKEKYEGKEQS